MSPMKLKGQGYYENLNVVILLAALQTTSALA